MKILVCVSKTPDTTSKISFTADGTKFNDAGITYIMNPYDEWYALVRACELVEKNGGTVTLINVGGPQNDQTIRKGLAIGATDAVRIDADPNSSLFIAKQIAEYAKEQHYDIIFCGKESIDYNGSEVGGMVAEFLDLPFISFASKLEITGSTATLNRDIEGGVEILEVETPFVVSAAKDMAEQRIPNMMGIMKAKSKPFVVVPPVDFPDLAVPVKYVLPKEKTGVRLVSPDNMEELVRLLHEEAKVI
ncbi:MAG: electron transfer flavoprotein subunit beta/FixA family protein [Saprospiraceae bacterium]|nr:electron transfer flavoprotein subunit beta/FixA family protein [Saprospiraceae bacterium]MCF8248553.1 electron transfer flavoprotein subunit beta/FixA family protein [Saprospiraceae bacterium]MCF8280280.1 electron transfer flavoprotein subunit beta/FixA family protein [Bacteroidales bacterium]MCF8310287.1 electron transfer flavoprotein subunit beta/FixA family protein [Saprospiraceae bacterium]MCF8439274.1 electron transfer flavoprotein subunit beta/FixA family protein [Saprospiraceae bacte